MFPPDPSEDCGCWRRTLADIFLDHLNLFLGRVIELIWNYAIPTQSSWRLLGNLYMYESSWLDLVSLTNRIYDLVFLNMWYNGGDDNDPKSLWSYTWC
jgi:hypothetical protein